MKKRTILAHAQSGDLHAVEAELHVLITRSNDGFVAQGLEIDYVATGSSEQEACDRFAEGFVKTVHAMCKRGRDLGALFSKSKTPAEAWTSYFSAANQHVLRCLSVHNLTDLLENCPKDVRLPSTMRFAAAH